MITITTRKLPATDTSGERIKATAGTGESLTIPFPYQLDAPEAHESAAKQLAASIMPSGFLLTRTKVGTTGYSYRLD